MTDTQEPQGAKEPHDVQPEPSASTASRSEPDDVAPPLVNLIASIRAALTRGASAELRAAGATACRSILTVLEARPGQPLSAAAAAGLPASAAARASPASPIASLLSQPGLLPRLAAMSREELLDLLKQVTGAIPAQAQTPASAAPRFHIVEVPRRGVR